MNLDDWTIISVARKTGFDPAELLELIEVGFVKSCPSQGQQYIFPSEIEKLFFLREHPQFRHKLTILNNEWLHYDHPELSDYLCFHGTLDLFCWMLKLRYSSREDIKRKNYQLHTLLDAYLTEIVPDLGPLKHLTGSTYSPERIAFHLNKGWYNELARSLPLEKEYLHIGTQTTASHSTGRLVAWNIVQSYYAVYEYVNALVFTNTSNLRTEEHRKSTRHFTTCLLKKFSHKLVAYPFNLISPPHSDLDALRGQKKEFWKYRYASSPRYPEKTIYALESGYLQAILDDGNLLNFLYGFRVWANYLGINTIIALQEGYYLSYLYKNLGTLCFFYGCFAELMAIAVLGEKRTLDLLKNIADQYIANQYDFRNKGYLIPMFVRFRIYLKHGLLQSNPDFLIPALDDPLNDLLQR